MHKDFRNLWFGQTISMFGAQITLVALPLVAAMNLSASPLQMGILQAAAFLPYLLLSLFIGVWLDWVPKRPILIAVDLLRALLLSLIPLGWHFGFLSMSLLFLIALLVGCNTVISDIGGTAYLPFVIEHADLAEGNTKLELSNSSATIVGQSLSGALIQALTAPFAIVFNVVSYLFSAIFYSFIEKQERKRKRERGYILCDMREGMAFVFGNNSIRILVITTLMVNLSSFLLDPVFILYITRTIHLSPIFIGLIFSSAGVGALLGAMMAASFAQRLGLAKTLITSLLLASLATFLLPGATFLPKAFAPILIILMRLVNSSMVVIYNIHQRSFRSSLTPDHLQGRMNASIRWIVMGISPVGFLLGGLLGELLGTSLTLIVGATGILCSVIFIALPLIRILDKSVR
jgi:MFS family permease